MAKKNRIFSGKSGIEDEAYLDQLIKEAMDELKRVTNNLKAKQKKYKKTALTISDAAVDITDQTQAYNDFTNRVSRIDEKKKLLEQIRQATERKRKILSNHEQAVRDWIKKGRKIADDAIEVDKDKGSKIHVGGQEAADFYAYIIESLGGDRTPDDYESDDVLEAADNLIQDNAFITKQNLVDEITAIKDKRDETLEEDVDSISFE